MILSRSGVRLATAVVLLVPLFAYWIINPEQNNEPTSQDSPLDAGADYYLSNANVKRFNESGTLSTELNVEKWEHFPSDKRSLLTRPSVQGVTDQQQTYTLKSKVGTLFDGQTQLTLDEEVVLTHNPNSDSPSRIETDRLIYTPETSMVTSDSAVRIINSDWTVSAKGISVDLNSHTSELSTDVEGTFYVDP